jgi:uncharacterized membrane protein YfcA
VSNTAYLLTFLGGFIAGMINSVAGGGTLISFPMLTFLGITEKVANATNTLALCGASLTAAFGFRNAMPAAREFIWQFSAVSVIGSVIGTILLNHTSNEQFKAIIPWLILLAAVLFIIQEPLTRRFAQPPPPGSGADAKGFSAPKGALLYQLCVGIYGGYFGAGMGVMMLAVLGFLQFGDIYRMNYLKNLAAFLINGVSAVMLAFYGLIHWPIAVTMAAGAVAGSHLGAGTAKKIGPRALRAIVSTIGVGIAVYMLYDRLRHK